MLEVVVVLGAIEGRLVNSRIMWTLMQFYVSVRSKNTNRHCFKTSRKPSKDRSKKISGGSKRPFRDKKRRRSKRMKIWHVPLNSKGKRELPR